MLLLPDARSRGNILIASLVAAALAWLSAGLHMAYGDTPGTWVLLSMGFGFSLAALTARVANGRIHAAYLLAGSAWGGLSALALVGPGLLSPALYGLPLVPIVAYLAMGQGAGLLLGVAVSITPLALWIFHPHLSEIGIPFGRTGLWTRCLALEISNIFGLMFMDLHGRALLSMNTQLDHQRNMLQALVDHLQSGVIITDENEDIVALNEMLCDAFQLDGSPTSLRGKNAFHTIVTGNNQPADPDAFARRIVELTVARDAETDEVEMADGRTFERDFVPLRIDGMRRGHLWCYHDVTARVVREREVLRRLQTDELSGAASRRHFHEQLVEACELLEPFAVLFIDLDGFKSVNDQFGHEVGDEALRLVGDRLRSALRDRDVVGRLGGDEFAVLARGVAELSQARAVANKLTERTNRAAAVRGHQINICASIGVAVYPKHGSEPDVLLKRADDAMYRAKRRRTQKFSLPPPQLDVRRGGNFSD